jgi:hypothetical protein
MRLTGFSDYPPASGLNAHIGLSRISTYIACNVYRIAPPLPSDDRSTYVENALKMLIEWSQALPPELQTSDNGVSNDRACCELHMAYNQVRTLYYDR